MDEAGRTPTVQRPTLREILARPIFATASVVAGREYLDRPVRWVHVGEIPDLASYLHGEELVLSTGVGLRQPRDRERYIAQLASRRVAGVCIELGRYLHRIPPDMAQQADRLGVPLVAFREPVRFVDITRDVHTLILQAEEGVLPALQTLGEELRTLAAGPAAVPAIVRYIGQWLGRPVVFVPEVGEPVTHGAAEVVAKLLEVGGRLRRGLDPTRTVDPDVRLLGGAWVVSRRALAAGRVQGLLLAVCDPWDGVRVGAAVDLAAGVLAQELYRRQSLEEERRQSLGASLLRRLMSGEVLASPLVREALAQLGLGDAPPTQAVVMLARGGEGGDARSAQGFASRLAAEGLRVVTVPFGGYYAFVVFDPPSRSVLHERVGRARAADGRRFTLGIGRRRPVARLRESLEEAEAALAAERMSEGRTSPFYEELGALRILLNLRPGFDLEGYVQDELGPVLEEDRLRGTDLVRTLAALLAANGQKEEAAQQLLIHRQTLYYRIRKLERLLGPDFLSPPRRLALELALLAREFLGMERT